MTILVLCREHNLCKELWGYARAFRRCGVKLVCVEEATPLNADLRQLLKLCPERPSLILQPESDFHLLPWGLAEVDIPTACFQFDTYAFTRRRILWSMLFDHAVIFHTGFESHFRQGGHPNPLTLANAAPLEMFEAPEEERVFEVGWVGRLQGAPYASRRHVLAELAKHFRMNDWRRYYPIEEVGDVYRRSKVVVNIGRDDFTQDANMRVFEAMAAGALLITLLPSELTALGFENGVHFVGYRNEREIFDLVRRHLDQEPERRRIAETGREKVRREHTYDCRVETLLASLEHSKGRLFAPARQWSQQRVRLAYLDYYAGHSALGCAYGEFRQIGARSLSSAVAGVWPLARGWLGQLRGRVTARLQASS